MTTDPDPTIRVRVRVTGNTPGPYTWRVYRKRLRWFWYVANWGEESDLSEALRVSALEMRAATR